MSTITKKFYLLSIGFCLLLLSNCSQEDLILKDRTPTEQTQVSVVNAQTFEGYIPQEEIWDDVISSFAKGVLVLPNGELIFTIKIEYEISSISDKSIAGVYIQERNSEIYYDYPLERIRELKGIIEIPISIDTEVHGGIIDIIYAFYDDENNVSPLRESWVGVEKSIEKISCGTVEDVEEVLNTMMTGVELDLASLKENYRAGGITFQEYKNFSEEVTFKAMVDLKVLGQSCFEVANSNRYHEILDSIEDLWEEPGYLLRNISMHEVSLK